MSSIQELRYLRGLDTGDKLKPRDHINATAARVGFSMPLYSDDLHDFTGDFPKPTIVPSKFSQDVHFGQQPVVPSGPVPSLSGSSSHKKQGSRDKASMGWAGRTSAPLKAGSIFIPKDIPNGPVPGQPFPLARDTSEGSSNRKKE